MVAVLTVRILHDRHKHAQQKQARAPVTGHHQTLAEIIPLLTSLYVLHVVMLNLYQHHGHPDRQWSWLPMQEKVPTKGIAQMWGGLSPLHAQDLLSWQTTRLTSAGRRIQRRKAQELHETAGNGTSMCMCFLLIRRLRLWLT